MTSIKIVPGKRGYHLKVNGLFICHDFPGKGEIVKAIVSEYGIPYGATEWVSVKAIRNFWATYRTLTIFATTRPYVSVWGQLEFIQKIQP